MNAYVGPLPGLFESGSRSRAFPNAKILAFMLPSNVNLLVGTSAVAGFLGLAAVLLGFANGVWIVLLASLPILWARLFRRASQVPIIAFFGEQSDAKALASLVGGHFENVLLRRVTDRVTRTSGQIAEQGNLF